MGAGGGQGVEGGWGGQGQWIGEISRYIWAEQQGQILMKAKDCKGKVKRGQVNWGQEWVGLWWGVFQVGVFQQAVKDHSSGCSSGSVFLTPLATLTSLATQKPSMLWTWGQILLVLRRSTWYLFSTNLVSPSSPTSISHSTTFTNRFLSAQLTTSSFSRGETEQVEQTITPPTRAQSMAARIRCFWMWEFLQMSSSTRLALMEWSLEMMPRPVQGASSSTRSNDPGKISGSLAPSRQMTTVLVMPRRYRLNCRAFRRSFLRSLANTHPVFFICWAMQVVLPPGAEAMSSTRSPACGSSAITGRKEEALCSMYWPARYSGVAPMGTRDSQILMPTLLHSARGSRLTPLWMRLWASSFLRVLRVLVRMVRGRWVSLASKNWTSSAGLKKLRKWSMSSKLQPQYWCSRLRSCSTQYLRGRPWPSLVTFMRMAIVYWICRLTTLMSTGYLSYYMGGASMSTYYYSPYPSSPSAPSSAYSTYYSPSQSPSSSSYPYSPSSSSISSSPSSISSSSSPISSSPISSSSISWTGSSSSSSISCDSSSTSSASSS